MCQQGLVSCGGQCVASNAMHCGTSCTACTGTQVCAGNSCSASCATGSMKCSDGACSSNNDAAHCGTQLHRLPRGKHLQQRGLRLYGQPDAVRRSLHRRDDHRALRFVHHGVHRRSELHQRPVCRWWLARRQHGGSQGGMTGGGLGGNGTAGNDRWPGRHDRRRAAARAPRVARRAPIRSLTSRKARPASRSRKPVARGGGTRSAMPSPASRRRRRTPPVRSRRPWTARIRTPVPAA